MKNGSNTGGYEKLRKKGCDRNREEWGLARDSMDKCSHPRVLVE